MNRSNLTSQERDFLWALEKIESRKIALGDHTFVDLQTVCHQSGLGSSEGLELAESLMRKGFLLLDRSTGNGLLKSKMANIAKTLFHTTTLVQHRFVHDVSDLKYLRFIKQIPKLTISLDDGEIIDTILTSLDAKQGFEHDIIELGIHAIASRYPKISAFQYSGVQEILRRLSKKIDNQSLVVVAETGAGKTLLYQMPLILWVLNKKIKTYLERKTVGKNKLISNCSALLLFPRNVLAKDQYDELISLSTRVSDKLKKMKLPTDLLSFLQIKIEKDFGGVGLKERTRIYQSFPDVIITNPETLKRRLMNPLCTSFYQNGIDLIVYDEVHLYYGLYGANVASLNARLQNLLPTPPIFVGMSATIANPEKHCQKLFAAKHPPSLVTDKEDLLDDFALEHHIILKPRHGRPSLGVCIDTTSCLLHNRRSDTLLAHQMDNELRPKTLCFVDSLDLTGRWTYDQKNYEYFRLFNSATRRFRRGYPIHYAPLCGHTPDQIAVCMDCKTGRDVMACLCEEYLNGQCWWFSQDSSGPVRWLTLPNGVTPNDNIRVKRLTSKDVDLSELEDIYALFTQRFEDYELPIDALIATSVLEVGVDFKGINEVVMYGEIRSSSSYKQRAGRGAREGNLNHGLYIMTVIPPSPLANFYYRHFHRLVYPSLTPLPLEPRNPDVVRAHAFCAIFDFLALQNIDIFNVIAAKQNAEEVEKNFGRAISFINNERDRVKNFVLTYLRRLGLPISRAEEIAENAVDKSLKTLEDLSSEYVINEEKKKLIIWAFEAFRDSETMAALEDDFEANLEERAKDMRIIAESRDMLASAKNKILNVISFLDERYTIEIDKLKKLLSKLEGII
jgi:superfamily II DNA or RNA helicase